MARWKRTVRRIRRRPMRRLRMMNRNQFRAQAREKALQQKLKRMNKENIRLKQRILSQERKAALEAEKKTMYNQVKEAKKGIFKVISPSLGNIDVDSPQVATGLAMLPWAVILVALITREG